MNPASRATSYKLLLSVGALLFSLVLAETGLRLFRPQSYMEPVSNERPMSLLHETSAIPGLSYDLAPNRDSVFRGIQVKTNSAGMRDRDRPQQKSPGTVRIAVIGDSYTFGLGVTAEEAFPSVLEGLLNDSSGQGGLRYEVLNFGVIGYCSRDEALFLKYKALACSPDVVILAYVLNDPETDPIQPLHQAFDKPRWWQHFHLLRLIAKAKNNGDIQRLGGGDYIKYLHAPGEEKWRSVVKAFQDIRDVTSARHIKVMVVIFPDVFDKSWTSSWANYPYRQIHKQVADLAVKTGLAELDLLDAWESYAPTDIVLKGHNDHPNRKGHRVTAEAILQRLLHGHPPLIQ